ncbi:MAG: tRNA pseudouridine(38-40) synthase TruA [Humidesulfovibrio sp.]|jgi:tRNA pseudouridine38-40 synthase|uniref:tRNA pseudouridine(38-40) synthase TruA n=1 Tax=Humidesulfovibrio sp. TaxID=2910988 RepID=UPI002732B5EE|nr:tRNA pseudouridine(38-40) synthase TruA [Humidesulfovibrio sp.]MDP2847096.1 tRNA pseudouridine(38-40) synthase TruA [Humidesulfovibrio sp.]
MTKTAKTMRIKLLLAYDGTDFAGWQHQGGVRTVQSDVEAALAKIIQAPTHVQAAGRTDSGVHALGQCAHFDAPEHLSHVPWAKALNCLLARDVRVVSATVAPPNFHAQFDAQSKIYAYTLWLDRSHVNPLRRRFVWDVLPPRLNVAAMDEAAGILMGTHDFNSFRNLGTPLGSRGTVRTLTGIWREPGDGPEMVWRFQANGFLKQMVRNIMGCLVAVGRGKVTPADVRCILEGRDRSIAPPTAPAMGLCMERVFYPGEGESAAAADAVSKDRGDDDLQMAGGSQRG